MSFLVTSTRDDLITTSSIDYPFTFPIYQKNDLSVILDGVMRLVDLEYFVRTPSGGAPFETLAESELPSVGLIRFPTARIPGLRLSIVSNQQILQRSQYTNEPFPYKRVEKDFDKVVMIARTLREMIGRGLMFAANSIIKNISVDDPIANGYLRYSADARRVISTQGIANLGQVVIPLSTLQGGLGRSISSVKGDLLVALGDGTFQRQPVGPNGTLVRADDSTPTGLAFIAPEAIELEPIGAVKMFLGATAPAKYLLLNGAAISRSTYIALFTLIGTQYGPGDGSTTFNLPNFAARMPVGREPSDPRFDNLGDTGGEHQHAITVAEMPAHAHAISYGQGPINAVFGSQQIPFLLTGAIPTTSVGGSVPMSLMPPFIVVNFIVKALP